MRAAPSHREIETRQRAQVRRLRGSMTDAECRLWTALRGHRFCAAGFRRQVPLGPHIVDFCCHAARLVVEVDGGRHAEMVGRRHDRIRDAFLVSEGDRVLRFWNHEVLRETAAVLDVVVRELAAAGVVRDGEAATPLPVPPPRGGRGRNRRVHLPAETSPVGAMREVIGDTHPPVPSPLVGEGQGEGSAAPSPSMVSRGSDEPDRFTTSGRSNDAMRSFPVASGTSAVSDRGCRPVPRLSSSPKIGPAP